MNRKVARKVKSLPVFLFVLLVLFSSKELFSGGFLTFYKEFKALILTEGSENLLCGTIADPLLRNECVLNTLRMRFEMRDGEKDRLAEECFRYVDERKPERAKKTAEKLKRSGAEMLSKLCLKTAEKEKYGSYESN